ncbi:MAG: hypothetical protein ABFQ53_00440 [Patescibacteria group bacterium]
MYYILLATIFGLSTLLPFGVIADEIGQNPVSDGFVVDVHYDFDNSRVYQIEGHSMEHIGFDDEEYVDVVPASHFNVGDVIAFECSHEKCDGAYIKEIRGKKDSCLWLEGRGDIWEENGERKQSMDSRTTYGWLCNDDINIYGVAFQK